jgi:hypothetical protein
MKLRAEGKRVQWDGGSLELPLAVKHAVRLGNRILVIHDYMLYDKTKPAANLVAYDVHGSPLWTAPTLTLGSPTDAYVEFMSEEPLWVGNFAGFNCRIDPETGRLLETVFTK